MSKYIEIDAFRREMYHEAFETDTDLQKWEGGCWIRYKLFENILEKQPIADVRENVHGEWKLAEDGWYCTACGLYPPFDCDPEEKGIPFCPWCGADMRKGEEE